MSGPIRRGLLATGASTAGGRWLACAGGDRTPSPASTDTPVPDDRRTLIAAELDLREATVVSVTVNRIEDRQYRFEVTLNHDDAGEVGSANRWQVETLDGDRLGRRELRHPHDQQPFTRSDTVAIPDNPECVVVRGHDQTHGYGGRAVLVTPPTGARREIRQGPVRRSLAEKICP